MGLIRAILALTVVLGHFQSQWPFGVAPMNAITAVQGFYVISGFLITMILNERPEYRESGTFYLSRYLRLWPTYAVIALLQLALIPQPIPTPTIDWTARLFLIFTNATIFLQDWTLFLRFDEGRLVFTSAFMDYPEHQVNWHLLVPQAWTLGIELSFYLIAPFFCRTWVRLAALLAASLCVRATIGFLQPHDWVWSYRFFPAEVGLFAAGGLAYYLGRDVVWVVPRAVALSCTVLLAVVITANTWFAARLHWPNMSDTLWLVNPVTILCLIIGTPIAFHATRTSRIDRFIGELSYPLYICHTFVMLLAKQVLGHFPSAWTGAALAVAASIVLYLGVGRPVDIYLRPRLAVR